MIVRHISLKVQKLYFTEALILSSAEVACTVIKKSIIKNSRKIVAVF
ncbi:hypothetical protein AP058_01216 [Flavobacterium sp. TAB 87]|nr:hypothetical protein AP058_01216 [Flavobacterium sp. TAB 87]